MILLAVVEGYKFAGGEIRRLTRPQVMFLSHCLKFKSDAKAGKKAKPSQGGPKLAGTPAELHAIMAPKFEKIDRESRDDEIARAQKVMKEWEDRHRAEGSVSTR